MIDALQAYREYKDSGLPWLDSIPQHWDCLPHRAIFREIKEQGHVNEPLLSVTIGRGIIRQDDLLANSSKKDSSNLDKSNYKLVEPGDIAYNKMRAWQGAVGVSRYRGIVSPAYIVQRLRGQFRPYYFHYLFRTPGFAKEAERWSYGITSDQWSLRPQHFKMIYSCVPPLDEQELIVGFLRGFDRQVRRFIRNRRRLIEVLNEQKQAIINQAVTRGLAPNAPLKPSGIDWLGDIPAHWKVSRLRNVVSSVTSGSRGWSSYAADDGPLFIRIANLRRGSLDLRFDSVVRLNLPSTSEARRTRVKPNDLLISITAYIGSVAVVPPDFEEAYVSQHVARCPLRDRQYNPRWLGYVLLSEVGQTHGRLSLYGGTKDGLSLNDVKNYPMVLPPRGEQDSIEDYLEKSIAALDHSIRHTGHEIDLIREYRTRLISDVVTGKVDVRHLAPLPGSEDLEERAEALEPLEEDIADGMVDDEEPIHEAD